MKSKLLLCLLLIANMLYARDTIRTLVITEARMDQLSKNYVEFTNMGDTAIQLSQFQLGTIGPFHNPVYDIWNDPWDTRSDGKTFSIYLPQKVLFPGETFLIGVRSDFGPAQYQAKVKGWEGYERMEQDLSDVADLMLDIQEDTKGMLGHDSVYLGVETFVLNSWNGRSGFFLEQHFENGDSVVVDQVNCLFDNDGKNFNGPNDVAGVKDATVNSALIRKNTIKTGNIDFASARGIGLDDSEWIPIQRPEGYDVWRDLWWTLGNHGSYVLDENTLEPKSDEFEVDFGAKKITVPWGTPRLDGIMRNMKKKSGLAWNTLLNGIKADSLYRSARTGDKLIVYVCGNELQTDTFDIIVKEPDENANIVIPIDHMNVEGAVTTRAQNGILAWPRVTRHESGIDTITGTWFGLPYAIRTDSLMKYLEKPLNASWEFVLDDGANRPDLKTGDKLKITAQNGAVKEYFIQTQDYKTSDNALLSSITWPDIPRQYRGMDGWKGDTLPGFGPASLNYSYKIPLDVPGIPAFVAKKQDLNAKVQMNPMTSFAGSKEDRTMSFVVTSEDDSITNTYSILLDKEKDFANLQPNEADPFFSEVTVQEQWGNFYVEIVNPGNQPLDLSNYMIAELHYTSDPAKAIARASKPNEWKYRYSKYVPGYKWVSEEKWAVNPGILELDLNVNSIVQPGDVFTMGFIRRIRPDWWSDFSDFDILERLDIQWNNQDILDQSYRNPWNENINLRDTPVPFTPSGHLFLFKILNDSIKLGQKAATDPNDFELLDAFGMIANKPWRPHGRKAPGNSSLIRQPDVTHGNPVMEASFGTVGTTGEDIDSLLNPGWTDMHEVNEWDIYDKHIAGYHKTNITKDIGQHFMYEITSYMSTVTSRFYKVSEGFSHSEDIRGMKPGVTVEQFLGNIYKADTGQVLTVKSTADGSDLAMDAMLSLNDTLVVLSADSTNTTKYILNVSEVGLSSNALLTSDRYKITIESEPKSADDEVVAGEGVITDFEYGTQLRTVVNNVIVPSGATMSIIDDENAYVPYKMLNFDTAYVNVTVNPDIYFEVLAEDGLTRIVYQLQPESSANDAFVLSDVYTVMQRDNLIKFVPRGTTISTFISYLVPSFGATVKLVDKMGNERTEGAVVDDDKVVVTSSNGLVTRTYHISMLRSEYWEPNYLAYVLSDVYAVDQIDYMISGPAGNTLLSEFYSRITPAAGATAVVIDRLGVEKTSGDLDDGDMLKVTSSDGKVVVMYKLDLDLTFADKLADNKIQVYPNPTAGKINIQGLEEGSRVQVFNQTGVIIRDMKVNRSVESITLKNQPSGMYLIVLTKDARLIGQYKVIRR